jgi:hypothetical protein
LLITPPLPLPLKGRGVRSAKHDYPIEGKKIAGRNKHLSPIKSGKFVTNKENPPKTPLPSRGGELEVQKLLTMVF